MKIFISYSSKDRDLVKNLGADLATLGHEVWFDQELSGGQAWWDTILTGIRGCDLFIFALTPRSLDSYPCKLEYTFAESLNKTILPILLKDVDTTLLPPALSKLQFVDYRQRDANTVLRLGRAFTNLPPQRPIPDPLPEAPDAPISTLGRIKELIDRPSLTIDQQKSTLFDLKGLLTNPETADGARHLLEALTHRHDITVPIANEIAAILKQSPKARTRTLPAQPKSLLQNRYVGVATVGIIVVLLVLGGIGLFSTFNRSNQTTPTAPTQIADKNNNSATPVIIAQKEIKPTTTNTTTATNTPTHAPTTKTPTATSTNTPTATPTNTLTNTPSPTPIPPTATPTVPPKLSGTGLTLTMGFAQEPDNLNGWYSNSFVSSWVWYLTQASLWDFDNQLGALPVLAEEIPSIANGGISSDGLTQTIRLKPGLKWSDGQPLTADDVLFSIQMAQDTEKNAIVGAFSINNGTVVSTTKVDDLTFQIKTTTPQHSDKLIGYFFILPKHIFAPVYERDKSLANAEANLNPTVFSGPYMLKEWKRGESLTFVSNPNYVFGQANIDQITIRIYSDTGLLHDALVAGTVDFAPNLTNDDVLQIKSRSKQVAFASVYGSYRENLWLNQRDSKFPREGHPALKSKLVRQALRLAINRDAIVVQLMNKIPTLTDSFWSDTPYFNESIQPVAYDPEAAKKLLDEAGWVMGAKGVRQARGVEGVADGTPLELIYITTTVQHRKDKQAIIQLELAKVGIKVSLKNEDATKFFGSFKDGGTTNTGAGDILEYATNAALTTPAIPRYFECNNISSKDNPNGQNVIGWCNSEFDALQLITEDPRDPETAKNAASRMQEILYDEVPVISLYALKDNFAYRTNKFSITPNVATVQLNPFYDIANWVVTK
jgi:peptide/nickel transport system substrate-binding protein